MIRWDFTLLCLVRVAKRYCLPEITKKIFRVWDFSSKNVSKMTKTILISWHFREETLWKCSRFVFPSIFDIIDVTTKTKQTTSDENSLKNFNKGIILSTINFNINMTAAKTKEMILKNLILRTKDTLGAPKNNRVKVPIHVE